MFGYKEKTLTDNDCKKNNFSQNQNTIKSRVSIQNKKALSDQMKVNKITNLNAIHKSCPVENFNSMFENLNIDENSNNIIDFRNESLESPENIQKPIQISYPSSKKDTIITTQQNIKIEHEHIDAFHDNEQNLILSKPLIHTKSNQIYNYISQENHGLERNDKHNSQYNDNLSGFKDNINIKNNENLIKNVYQEPIDNEIFLLKQQENLQEENSFHAQNEKVNQEIQPQSTIFRSKILQPAIKLFNLDNKISSQVDNPIITMISQHFGYKPLAQNNPLLNILSSKYGQIEIDSINKKAVLPPEHPKIGEWFILNSTNKDSQTPKNTQPVPAKNQQNELLEFQDQVPNEISVVNIPIKTELPLRNLNYAMDNSVNEQLLCDSSLKEITTIKNQNKSFKEVFLNHHMIANTRSVYLSIYPDKQRYGLAYYIDASKEIHGFSLQELDGGNYKALTKFLMTLKYEHLIIPSKTQWQFTDYLKFIFQQKWKNDDQDPDDVNYDIYNLNDDTEIDRLIMDKRRPQNLINRGNEAADSQRNRVDWSKYFFEMKNTEYDREKFNYNLLNLDYSNCHIIQDNTETRHQLNDKDKMRYLEAIIDFQDTSLVNAVAGLFGYLLNHFIIQNDYDVTKFQISKNNHFVYIDKRTYQALQIFKPVVNNASAQLNCRKCEGFSLFKIFQGFTSTPQGKKLLKNLFLSPINDLNKLEKRLETVEFMGIILRIDECHTIRRCLKGISNLNQLVKNLNNFKISNNNWRKLIDSISNIHDLIVYLKSLLNEIVNNKSADFPEIITKLVNLDIEPLEIMDDVLKKSVLFDNTNDKIKIRHGFNEELDELIEIREKMLLALQEYGYKLKYMMKNSNIENSGFVYMPQLGYFIVIPKKEVYDPPANAALNYMFSQGKEMTNMTNENIELNHKKRKEVFHNDKRANK